MENPTRKAIVLTILIAAGETVFLLPFVVARIFRPTFLDVFGLTNLQLGTAFALYGVIAMVSYFLGGPLADRYSARKLMTLALILTAIGGVLFAAIPSLTVLTILYGFWGLTTILLFWAALIRATREWGGVNSQGKAYGAIRRRQGTIRCTFSFDFSMDLFVAASGGSGFSNTSGKDLRFEADYLVVYRIDGDSSLISVVSGTRPTDW